MQPTVAMGLATLGLGRPQHPGLLPIFPGSLAAAGL